MIVNIADLVDRNDAKGRTFREINKEKTHNISIGSLVETEDGCRLFVVDHGRDCDETPLYGLSGSKDDIGLKEDGHLNYQLNCWCGWFGKVKVVKEGSRNTQPV